MSLIIPGVEIRVIRELVPRPLGAAGVLGIVGCTEVDLSKKTLQTLGSLQEFRQTFGPGSIMSMPEVKQAFAAGLNQVVVANIPPDLATAASTEESVKVGGTATKLKLQARTNGAWGNKLWVRLASRDGASGEKMIELKVFYADQKTEVETFRNMSGSPEHERYFVNVINEESAFVRAELPMAAASSSMVLPDNTNPDSPPRPLTLGTDPLPANYGDALSRLEANPEVDMVAASFEHEEASAAVIYADIISHCERMSRLARPRIGFGQVAASGGNIVDMVTAATRMVSRLISERFVFVAPNGYVGAVIGMIAGLGYYESPTFKTLGGVSSLSFDFTDSHLNGLIQAGVCAVDEVPRKGIACVKGITSDADQINVRRIADRAVRHVQNIAQDFIGLLNTEEQRLALKQRITEAFTRMEREGAIVPSTDGKSPPFEVSVESTPDEFARGEVRIDMAIRPVRAIDYIYATIKVKAF